MVAVRTLFVGVILALSSSSFLLSAQAQEGEMIYQGYFCFCTGVFAIAASAVIA